MDPVGLEEELLHQVLLLLLPRLQLGKQPESEHLRISTTPLHKGTLSRETELSVALQKEKSSHEFRNRFLTARKIEGWNSLPDSVKEPGSAAVFKR